MEFLLRWLTVTHAEFEFAVIFHSLDEYICLKDCNIKSEVRKLNIGLSKNNFYGLDERQVVESREKNGDNRLSSYKRKSLFSKILENLSDPIIKILVGALGANIIFNFSNINWAECGGIILAIIISTLVSTLSERGSEKAFEKLRSDSVGKNVRVIRSGKETMIPFDDIVVGDYVVLSSGESVPCDGRVVSGCVLTDQSALNGESAEVWKAPTGEKTDFIPHSSDCIFRGSLISEGQGIMICKAVGQNTLYGKIAGELTEQKRQSPLKLRLEALARAVSKIGYFAAALVGLTYLFNVIFIDSGFSGTEIMLRISDWRFMSFSIIKAITIAITVVVVAVPEGLPMMITVILSSNMKKMLKSGVLVRKPVGIETAGSMNILFTDKTGTITCGKLTAESIITADGVQYKKIQALEKQGIYNMLLPSLWGNCDAALIDGKIRGGNSTDRAILEFLDGRSSSSPIIEHLPFDSKRKFSASVLPGLTVYKGAPERIISRCSKCYDKNGNIKEFSTKTEIVKKVSEISRLCGRVIAVAAAVSGAVDTLPEDMIFICIIKLRDSLRPEARSAVSRLRNAGIQSVMITGDGIETATAVALEAGVIHKNTDGLCIESSSLSAMSDDEIKSILPRLAVVARALPSDKSRLVRIAESVGMVVGMTGDGVNDAPALKRADVGFSMGSGTDIAKEASDIVILDNNLSSIANAVLFGRTIFKSIRKFILFQLTMNLSAVGVSLFGQLLGIDAPVTVIQMLWVNIIMDTLGGLAFAGEYPLERYMKEKPKRRDEPIFTKTLLLRIIIVGMFVVGLCVAFLSSPLLREFYGYYHDPIYFMTAFFALFIFMGIGVSFISRGDSFFTFSGLSKNKPFIIIMLFVLIIQLSMVYFGKEVFRCAPLDFSQMILVCVLSLTVFPADFVRKICMKLLKK